MVRIEFDNLSIKNVVNSSGVFTGDNIQIGFKNTRKVNEGMGASTGDVTVTVNNRHLVMDQDTCDFVGKDEK
ncbi:spore germination protein [Alteribacter populi]|uniref:spore germination protein n=1 Tax=Alteribacter populi TaxID=2011011 RepID=UPI0012FF9211|nr:spore germination protein [Alteribacter populi]